MAGHILLIVALCAAVVAPGSATYTLQMRFRRYFNPENHDFEGNCCDLAVFCHISPCDVYFTFCLRAIYTPATTVGNCWQLKSTSSNPVADNLFTAPETGPIYPNSPVSNYITFQGNNYPTNGFQMAVRVEDQDDATADDLVDVVLFNKPITPGSGWTSYQNTDGYYGRVEIDARFQIYCNTDYYGSACNIYCVPTDNSQGHYTCASNGNKVCRSGWIDPSNDCLTPVCTSGCSSVGGFCNSPNQCLCHNGWSGSLCNQCIPSSTCVHGTCNSPGQCNCMTGYGGTNCDQDLDVCGHQEPCLHGATCSNDGPDQYSCSCAAGYTGNNCQTDINECGPLPCLNGATCNDNLNHFSCLCATGWTGSVCSVNIDDCDPDTCQNGNCTDLVNGYTCQCEPGWTGAECDINIDECQSNPCQNNANCTDLVNGFTCQCATGWTGITCTQNIDECDPNPCQNRGNCTDRVADYQCDCAVGYYGKSCEDHYCDSSPCDNGATCTGTADGYVCTCPRGVTGANCSVDINECATLPCTNGGTCVNLLGDYSCNCPNQYRGKNCEYNEQIPQCSPNPCPQGLTCADGDRTDYVCIQCSSQSSDCNFVIDSEALAANATKQDSILVIGAAAGGIGGALLLICPVLLLVIILCCCKTRKNTEEPHPLDDEKGYVPNPTYKSATTLVSTNNGQNFNPYDVPDYSRDVPNPLYASSSTSATLPLNGAVQGKTAPSSEDCKRHSAIALNNNSVHFTRQHDDNVYTYDPTEEEADIAKDGVYSEVVDDDMKRAAPPEPAQPVENVYDYIPGDMDPSAVYEKLPPQMPL